MLRRHSHCLVPRGRYWTPAARRRERGLTLIELLIALALLAFILLGIAPLFLASVKSNFSANEYTSVNILARDRLEQLMNRPFLDTELAPGFHDNDQMATLPDPTDPTALSTVLNPFTITYTVEQYQIPASAGIAANAAWTPALITVAGQPFHYKRIDVTVQTSTGPLGIGSRVTRVSGVLNNPSPNGSLSVLECSGTCP